MIHILFTLALSATLQPAKLIEQPQTPVQSFRYDGHAFTVNGESIPATLVAAWRYDGRTMRLVRRDTVFLAGFDVTPIPVAQFSSSPP